MKTFLKKLFCNHNNKTEVGRYYVAWSIYGGMLIYPDTFLDVYKTYTCNTCRKHIVQKLLSKQFFGWNHNREFQEILESKGYISYDQYMLREL